ncbi:MAG: GNAT family protein, partial [Candidatus Phosphoribacter sp.]
WHRGIEAVVAMTGHAYLAVAPDLSDAELEAHGVDGLGGAHQPRVAELIRGSGWADTLDVLLVASLPAHRRSAPGPDLVPREDLAGHPRVAVAQQVRSGIRVLGMPSRGSGSVVTIATGVGGVVELGIQAEGDHTGRELIDAALRWVGDELGDAEPLVASVPPGNARSLRLFLRSGFIPVGSVQLFRPERQPW